MIDKTKAPARATDQEDQARAADHAAPERRFDETEPGGKYLAADNKTFVDANGEPIDGKQS